MGAVKEFREAYIVLNLVYHGLVAGGMTKVKPSCGPRPQVSKATNRATWPA
jgi:hypothetical protein